MEHKNGSKTSMATLIKAIATNKTKNVSDHPGEKGEEVDIQGRKGVKKKKKDSPS